MKRIDDKYLVKLVESALFVADSPLTVQDLKQTVLSHYQIGSKRVIGALEQLQHDYQSRGVELVKGAKGYRFQAVSQCNDDLALLFKERAPRYSRALLETLALIAYKQPITRSEIEDVRGVAVSSYIIKTLLERNWVKISGHKEVPGRPALYVTTKDFLDYFSLPSLAQLPELMPLPTTP
jgi:segregation and condensation protein B